jgi:hypothetical protein
MDAVTQALNGVVTSHGDLFSDSRIVQLLALVLWTYADGVCQEFVVTMAKEWLQKNVFTPWAILQEMDIAGGTLSYEGIEVLRRVETKGGKHIRGSVIPSSSEIKRVARMVEHFAEPLCPFNLQPTPVGEMIQFDIEKTLRTVLGAYGLLSIAVDKSVSVTQSIDGAQLSKNLSHTTGGIKISDRCTRCPFTKKLILQDVGSCNAQSRSYCFPLTTVMSKETNDSVQLFKPMFQFFEDCTKAETNRLQDLKPLTVSVNCDMSAQWKGLCKGGGKTKH